MVDIGNRIRELRTQQNLTQKQLALQIGCQYKEISFYELGVRKPSLPALVKLSQALHTTADYLLGLDKRDTIDVSGLSDADKTVVYSMVENMRVKNKELKK